MAHVYLYCKQDQSGNVVFVRAYKYFENKQKKTVSCQHFCYSEKAKRYVKTNFYILDWGGHSLINVMPEYQMMRQALIRIGMDMR